MGCEPRVVVCAEDDLQLGRDFHDPRVVMRGPATTGDIWGLMRHDVAAIVIIDCGQPSVWHREIADVVRAGIRVIGAGRVGALRAVEMTGLGMEGCGRVHALFAAGGLERDDELLDSSDGLALIDLRCTLDETAINSGQRDEILHHFAALPYRHRTREALRQILAGLAVPEGLVSLCPPNVRRQDSLDAIRLALQSCPHGEANVDADAIYGNNHWQWLRTSIMYRSFVLPEGIVPGHSLAQFVQEQVGAGAFTRLSREFFVLQWLKEHDLRCPTAWVTAYRDRHAQLLADDDFLLGNGLTRAGLAHLLFAAAVIGWAEAKVEQLLPEAHATSLEAFAQAWARENGIEAPEGQSSGSWVVAQGPCFFGFAWDYPSALLECLQREGAAAGFARAHAAQAADRFGEA